MLPSSIVSLGSALCSSVVISCLGPRLINLVATQNGFLSYKYMPFLFRRLFPSLLFSATFFSRLPTKTIRFRKMELSTTVPVEVGPMDDAKMREESPLSDVPEDAPVPKPKAPRKRKAPAKAAVEKDEGAEEKPKRQPRKRKAIKDPIIEGEDEAEVEKKSSPKRRRKATTTGEGNEEDGEPKKKRRRKTPEEEKVFNIPPIENVLSTTFKGWPSSFLV